MAAGAYFALGRDTAPVPQPLPTDAVTVEDITPPVASPKPAETPAPVAKTEPESPPPAPPIEKTEPVPEPVAAPAVAHVARKRSAKEVVVARAEEHRVGARRLGQLVHLPLELDDLLARRDERLGQALVLRGEHRELAVQVASVVRRGCRIGHAGLLRTSLRTPMCLLVLPQ